MPKLHEHDLDMPRREFIRRSALTAAAVTLLGPEAVARSGLQGRPNVVLINADDLGFGDLGCYGSEKISTPNLDALARHGVRFTDFHSCAPVCTPSRAGLMTGRYAIRSGLTRVLGAASRQGIGDDEVTVAELLKIRGYATACIGKWHLGHLPQYLPMRHGFDYYYGIPYSNNMGSWKDGKVDVPLMRGEETIERPAIQETLTQRYTEEAVEFIRQHRREPFFVYLPHTMPHRPWYASERFKGRSKAGLYGDAVEEIDWSVGEVVKALRELGLTRNTLVMFTSDNGPNGGSVGPLRGAKATVFEGGMRLPFIACWPDRIRESHICRQPASNLDILPTLAAVTGAIPPADRIIDGRDITGLLTTPGKMMRDYPFFYFRTHAIQAARLGRWKLHVGRGTESLDKPELYDLQLDMGEKRDAAEDHPEIVRELLTLIEDFRKALPPNTAVGGSPDAF